jgi:hypothetical protein
MDEPTVISDDPRVQEHYERCLANGCSHNLAEMLALKTFPGSKGTDRSFMQGRYHKTGGAQFEALPESIRQEYMRKAERAGVNPTGKWYSGGLARFPADPMAWVDGLSDVKRVAEARGAEVSGAVDIEPPRYRDLAQPRPYQVAPDLVAARVSERLAEGDAAAVQDPERRQGLADSLARQLAGVHGTRSV